VLFFGHIPNSIPIAPPQVVSGHLATSLISAPNNSLNCHGAHHKCAHTVGPFQARLLLRLAAFAEYCLPWPALSTWCRLSLAALLLCATEAASDCFGSQTICSDCEVFALSGRCPAGVSVAGVVRSAVGVRFGSTIAEPALNRRARVRDWSCCIGVVRFVFERAQLFSMVGALIG
jgi:hypothetical protein